MTQRFGEMLVSRRRQMGISLQQAANAIKMRPQIIEYFETENFAAMPPRGYAQGMIASYARYLGLNPHEVVDAYFDALHDYEHRGGRAGRYQEAAFDPNPRSAQLPGRYHVMDADRPGSRYARRPPQAGYVSEETSPHEPVAASRLRPLPMANARRSGAGSPGGARPRSRTTRGPQASPAQGCYRTDPRGSLGRRPRTGEPGSFGALGDAPRQPYRDDRCAPRSMPPQRQGRPRSRGGNGLPPQGRGNGGSTRPLDPRYLIMAVIALLVVVALVALLLLRGCAPKDKSSSAKGSAPVQSVQTDGTSSNDADSSDEGDQADDPADDPDAPSKDATDAKEPAVPEKTMVKVKVSGDDVVAWVEINLDGRSVMGKQVVGGFEQEFEVTQQIDITTDKPTYVTVYKNGEKVRYDTKVSGVAKVSIAAPKVETVDLSVDIDDDGVADMTAEDALNAGYDVENRTVDTVTIPLSEYAYAPDADESDTSGTADAPDGA